MESIVKDFLSVIRAGRCENTYKLAWGRAIIELCAEDPDRTILPLTEIANKVFKYYTLQDALSKGLLWHDELVSGKFSSINEIARNEGVSRVYILRRIRMAFLAPDIIKAIMRSEIPLAFNFSQIRDGFPINWEDQQKMFGFLH